MKLGNNLCKHQSVIKVTRWNLKVISLRVDLLHYILTGQQDDYDYQDDRKEDLYQVDGTTDVQTPNAVT